MFGREKKGGGGERKGDYINAFVCKQIEFKNREKYRWLYFSINKTDIMSVFRVYTRLEIKLLPT